MDDYGWREGADNIHRGMMLRDAAYRTLYRECLLLIALSIAVGVIIGIVWMYGQNHIQPDRTTTEADDFSVTCIYVAAIAAGLMWMAFYRACQLVLRSYSPTTESVFSITGTATMVTVILVCILFGVYLGGDKIPIQRPHVRRRY